jgi:hypothetical protein
VSIATNRRRSELGLGRYYIADANGVIDADVDLEELARELGVMQSWGNARTRRAPNICLFSAFITLLFARSRWRCTRLSTSSNQMPARQLP